MCSVRRDVLKSFAKFTGKHLCQSLFLNKVEERLRIYFLNKTSGIFTFVSLLLTIPDKTGFHSWKFCKIVWHQLEIPRLKTKTHGNSTLTGEHLLRSVFWMKVQIIRLSTERMAFWGSFISKRQPPWCLVRKGVLMNFAKFTGKHQCQILFCNNVAG